MRSYIDYVRQHISVYLILTEWIAVRGIGRSRIIDKCGAGKQTEELLHGHVRLGTGVLSVD